MNNQSNEFTDRLVTLSDGRQGLRGTIHTEVREPSPSPGGPQFAERFQDLGHPSCGGLGKPLGRGEGGISQAYVLDFVSSDETLDRYDEIVTASGWKLANYQRNPVFQNSHQYGDIIFTLGRALTTEIRSGKLVQRIQFATEVNPVAKLAYGLYKGKFLNAVSVGFVPLRWENGTQETPYRRKYIKQELLEVSAVSIPANPNTLALAYKSGAIEKSDIRELSQLLLSVSITAGTHEKHEFEHLLRLANQWRADQP